MTKRLPIAKHIKLSVTHIWTVGINEKGCVFVFLFRLIIYIPVNIFQSC